MASLVWSLWCRDRREHGGDARSRHLRCLRTRLSDYAGAGGAVLAAATFVGIVCGVLLSSHPSGLEGRVSRRPRGRFVGCNSLGAWGNHRSPRRLRKWIRPLVSGRVATSLPTEEPMSVL